MKPIKIAMLSLTHGHTKKYFQVLSENPLLDWVGVQVSDSRAKEYFRENVQGIPVSGAARCAIIRIFSSCSV